MSTKTVIYTASCNNTKRTFTIRRYINGILDWKCRTYPIPRKTFKDMKYYTSNDWEHYLKHSEDYYTVTNYYTNNN